MKYSEMLRYLFLATGVAMLFPALLSGCGEEPAAAAADGRLPVYSGLPPIAYIAGKIGGERVYSRSVLPEGRSPHDYSPDPHDIRGAATSKLFFTTRMNFEQDVVRPLDPSRVKIIDVTEKIQRIPFDGAGCNDPEHHHHPGESVGAHAHDHEHGHDECSIDGLDPHVWLSLDNAVKIAEAICEALVAADPDHAPEYRRNLVAFRDEMAGVEAKVKQALAPYRDREFYVYHPAFGYFAAMTGLKQVAVELGGREATPAHLAGVIRRARASGVRAVFVQPQFNPTSARALARAIDGEAVGLDPLAADLPGNVLKMAEVLKQGFDHEGAK